MAKNQRAQNLADDWLYWLVFLALVSFALIVAHTQHVLLAVYRSAT